MDSNAAVTPSPYVIGGFWDDGTFAGIRALRIISGSVIDSIQILYDNYGASVWSRRHGGSSGTQLHEVKLNYPDEYLISVSGYRTVESPEHIIKSLTFRSNRRTYGPFGWEEGEYFSVVGPAGQRIIGFSGTSANFLNSIKAHYESPEFLSSVGPYGGKGGRLWDDGAAHSAVRKIKLCFDNVIHSFQVEYEDNAGLLWSERHGGSGGGTTRTVELLPEEYLTCVTGYYSTGSSDGVIQSLSFHSQLRSYGPFGVEKGHYFSLSSLGGKIISFFGRSGNFLDALGAHMAPIHQNLQSLGPFGGNGGISWDDNSHSGIKEIKVVYGDVIGSITFLYDGDVSSTHGGSGGDKSEMITLNYPEEFLISVSGYYLQESSLVTVSSLTFQTNKRCFKPIGREEGRYFSFPSFSGKIVGFFGRSGSLLDSIGGYVLPLSTPSMPFFVKPFGGQGGNFWDDGMFTTVRGLEIWHGSTIDCIAIEYDKNGHSVWSQRHGSSVGSHSSKVELDYPNEFIVSIGGHHDLRSNVICSLTIHTNKKPYGPFGTQEGEEFTLSSHGGKVIGFSGRSENYLDAIGLYVNPISLPSYHEIVGPYGGIKGGLWDHGVNTAVRKIELYVGKDYINAFRVEYDEHGHSKWSEMRGGTGPLGAGTKHVVELDFPGEYIISVTGHYDIGSGQYVRSLTFKTNKKSYGPFGHPDGDYFKFPHVEGKIVGFHGRSGWYIDAIGAYVVLLPNLSYPSEILQSFGGDNGEPWDDGVHDTIRSITLAVANYGIEYIQFEYDKNGRSILGKAHGREDQTAELIEIELDYPNEVLISISGYYGAYPSLPSLLIQSLTFHSNKRSYGPYGHERGTPFSFERASGKIVGFHGKETDICISSLGVYLKPISD